MAPVYQPLFPFGAAGESAIAVEGGVASPSTASPLGCCAPVMKLGAGDDPSRLARPIALSDVLVQ
jgi:hypothetical protein